MHQGTIRLSVLFGMLFTLVFAEACNGLTSLDGDDQKMTDSIVVNLNPGALEALGHYAMNRYAQEWLDDKFSDYDVVARMECESSKVLDEDGTPGIVHISDMDLLVKDVLTCLRESPSFTMIACIQSLLKNAALPIEEDQARYEEQYGLLSDCRHVMNGIFMDENDGYRKTWDINEWPRVELAKMLISMSAEELKRRPVLMAGLGVAVVGGIIVALPTSPIALLLCPLSDAIMCPDDPGAPGVPQHPPSGGDR
jgi:hypothetical protein